MAKEEKSLDELAQEMFGLTAEEAISMGLL
jgi:hypothetical protein